MNQAVQTQNNTDNKIKVTIDRATWRTGGCPVEDDNGPHSTGEGPTYLRNAQGYQCCLGFISLALGCTPQEIADVATPCQVRSRSTNQRKEELGNSLADFIELTNKVHLSSDLASDAMGINDDGHLTADEKEAKLLKLFANTRYELQFTGEYPSTPTGKDHE